MVTIYAGSGYGKTRTVYSFLQKYHAYTTWIQVSERDNVVTRFWENYAHTVSLTWPEIGERLLEIGFPESDEAFAKYAEQRNETLSNPIKHFLVYDDFHLLHNPAVLNFFERATNTLPANGTVILLSRTMPEINMTGMMMRERVFTIREDTLCFTEDEIAKYFNQLELPATRQDVRDIYEDTRGWAFAINLIGRSMRKDTKYERYALEAMKANVFKLIETEISQIVSERLAHFLLRISLIDNHAASLIRMLADDDSLVGEMEMLNAYIRYDHFLGSYMIHNLFLDYLKQYQGKLSDEDKQETYQKAGVWCEENDFLIDALTYYEKSGDWDAILRIAYTLNFPVPLDIAKYILEIFKNVPIDTAAQNQLFPAIILKLKMSIGSIAEANALAKQFAKEYEARPDSPAKNQALAKIYGTWGVLGMIMCSEADVYDFDELFEKQRFYYDRSPDGLLGSVTNLMVGSYALLVGTNRAGAMEEYIAALSRAIPHTSYLSDGSLYGLDDLSQGELFYFRREMGSAEQYLKQALDKARSKGQYEIQNRALLYLMLVAFSRGEIKVADSLLQQMKMLLEVKEFTTRYESFDIALSHYYMALGQPELIPDWLKSDFSPYAHPAFIENYANRVKVQYRYMTQRYSELLAFLENAWESQTLLMGKIVFKVVEALSLYQVKQREKAIYTLSEAYWLAEPNRIIVPFTQYAKDMRTLTAAALKCEKCTIPKEWLENINRKASAFARRKAHLITECKTEIKSSDEIPLTRRESEILKDLSQGLSRTEIAASQNISVNTVKMNINIIYEKLHASNLVNAVRIAADRGMI